MPMKSKRYPVLGQFKHWRETMSRWPILFAIAVFALASAAAIPLFAQPGGYQPAPPLSPWLNLYRKQGGPVDNYHMYVQPQLQLQDTLHAQQMGIETNAAAVDAVGERNMSQRDASFAAPRADRCLSHFLQPRHLFQHLPGDWHWRRRNARHSARPQQAELREYRRIRWGNGWNWWGNGWNWRGNGWNWRGNGWNWWWNWRG